jgi:hypothetical protein
MVMIMIIGGVALVQLSQSSNSGSKEVKADSLAGVVSVLLGKSGYDKINIIAVLPFLLYRYFYRKIYYL